MDILCRSSFEHHVKCLAERQLSKPIAYNCADCHGGTNRDRPPDPESGLGGNKIHSPTEHRFRSQLPPQLTYNFQIVLDLAPHTCYCLCYFPTRWSFKLLFQWFIVLLRAFVNFVQTSFLRCQTLETDVLIGRTTL